MQITHHIISMKRGETKENKSPMWRCNTLEGDRVNVFQHTDPAKNNFALFDEYEAEMLAMKLEEETTWKQHPIEVRMIQDGKWWEVVAVADRPKDALPD